MAEPSSKLNLDSPVRFVPTVGEARGRLLERLGIRTAGDLLWHIPKEIVDLTHVRSPSELVDGELSTVRGTVADMEGRPTARGGTLSSVLLHCRGMGGQPDGYVRGIWFNQPWQLNRFRAAWESGAEILLSGKPKFRAGKWEFSHPQTQVLAADDREESDETDDGSESPAEPALLFPKYGLTEGLSQFVVRRACRHAAQILADDVPDAMPQTLQGELDVVSLRDALLGLHAPDDRRGFDRGVRRVLFSDLFDLQLGVALRRRAWKTDAKAPSIAVTAKVDARIRRLFPFQWTDGQEGAIKAIVADLKLSIPMHRLLQADVGAGKTVVAIYAMLATIAEGHQAVLMAPTELLAVQHAETVELLLSQSRVRRTLLTGRLTASERKRSLDEIRRGEIDLVIGTQAVIQKDVVFPKLGLVVIDEQHKFGVAQRAHFSQAEVGDAIATPHVLVMTATPIPRSICLTTFGDLDLTVMSERPPGRQPIATNRVLTAVQRRKMWDFVRGKLDEGRQLYVVSPRVDGDDDTPGAERLYEELRQTQLSDYQVGLIHGRMDRDLRDAVMDEFRVGNLDAVVATTVIEVGVDVPNATLMIIDNAGLFGLSQLHQLRGRIGRGSHRSFCFLVSDANTGDDSTAAASRLAIMEETEDGFAIAERDLELRGAGDVLGTRQSGQSPLRFADLVRDHELLDEARRAAFDIVQSGRIDEPEFAALKRDVLDRFGELMNLPRSG